MILTCPECATRYFAPDDSVGPNGRTVRCASCGASWRAMPESETPLELEITEADLAPALSAAPPAAAAEPEEEAEDVEVPVSELPGEELPKVFRERVKARRETRRAAASGLVWGLAAAAFVAALGGLAVARQDVVKAWPKSASAYALLGLPVNATGLVIEQQQAALEFDEGRPALIVRGSIRNIEDHAVSVPPLQFILLDAHDKPLATKISQATNPTVPADASRYFQESVLDPPKGVAKVDVTFAIDSDARQPVKTARLRTAG